MMLIMQSFLFDFYFDRKFGEYSNLLKVMVNVFWMKMTIFWLWSRVAFAITSYDPMAHPCIQWTAVFIQTGLLIFKL